MNDQTTPERTVEAEGQSWEQLYRRMRDIAAAYSNFCDDIGSTRKLERKYIALEDEARALADAAQRSPQSAEPVALPDVLAKCWRALSHPIDGWKGEVERIALDAIREYAETASAPPPVAQSAEPTDAELLKLAHAHKYEGPPEADRKIVAMLRAARSMGEEPK